MFVYLSLSLSFSFRSDCIELGFKEISYLVEIVLSEWKFVFVLSGLSVTSERWEETMDKISIRCVFIDASEWCFRCWSINKMTRAVTSHVSSAALVTLHNNEWSFDHISYFCLSSTTQPLLFTFHENLKPSTLFITKHYTGHNSPVSHIKSFFKYCLWLTVLISNGGWAVLETLD